MPETHPGPTLRDRRLGASWIGPALLLTVLTGMMFTDQYRTLAGDQQKGHAIAWIATSVALMLAGLEARANWLGDLGDAPGVILLLANATSLWMVIDHLSGDLLATLTAIATSSVTVLLATNVRRS